MQTRCFLLFLCLCHPGWSQESVLVNIEPMPEFEGGSRALDDYIQKHFRFPVGCQVQKEIKVCVQVTIDANGQLSNPIVVTPVDTKTDQAIAQLVNEMPPWQPLRDAHGRAYNTTTHIWLTLRREITH